jgi:hypothetical protein
VEFVVAAKKEVGRLWDQEGVLHGVLFPTAITGLRVCRMVRIFRFIDQILAATERSENGYHRRMFFRHGRYFIMAFVSHRSNDVLARPAFDLSNDDRMILSQRTNEIAEAIYAQTVPLQTVKGYLAIFRNQTDSQPLAEGVLQRLAQQDQQRQAQPPPANPNAAPPVAASAASAAQTPGYVA